jgi:peptide/nickel transport system substrate-binding protein
MATERALTRRRLLIYGANLGGLGLLAACAPAAPAAAPTAVPPAAAPPKPAAPAAPPPKPAAEAKPTAEAKPAAEAKPTTAAKPAAVAPPAAAKPADQAAERPGRHLIGTLEGPTVVTDAAQIPRSLSEAPELAALVKAGTLPPVAERIGQDPLVVKPGREIGKYGGTLRRGFTGPGDKFNGYRTVGHDNLLYWDYTGNQVQPNIARGWEERDDGRTILIHLRRGMKWSDGQPFTADDFVFWYRDMYQNKDLYPTPAVQMTINGKPVAIEKVDDHTVAFRAPDPYYVLPVVLTGQNALAGHAQYGLTFSGPYAPAHYLKQFHPAHVSQDALNQAVADAKVDNWVNLFKFKNDWALNPELPVVTAWRTVTPINSPTWSFERNPYSIWVDTQGNQLPYIDKIQMQLAENLEILNLRAIAGDYDYQERHVDLGKLPVFLENQQRGGYKVHLDPAEFGSDASLVINMSFEADAEIAKWLSNRDFRTAMSLGIDRDQLNEALWLGMGTPGSYVVSENSRYNPGPEYRTLNHTHDPARANALLDQIGLDKKDAEGFRLRADGQRLRIELMTQSGVFFPLTKVGEMVADQWKRIGLQGDVKEVERSFAERRIQANEHQIAVRATDGTEDMFAHDPSNMFPAHGRAMGGPLYGTWFASVGTQGKEPPARMKEMFEKYRRAYGVPEAERIQLARDCWKICVEELFVIGTVGLSPATTGVRVVKQTMGNVADRQLNSASHKSPGPAIPEQFYFK